jgi:DNA modification methylase
MIQLLHGDCLELMKNIPDGSVDLTVTSPPYDNLRTYNGNINQWNFDKFKEIAKELYRITKGGGVVVWIVADATIKGSETGTSFRQALHFMDCGFNLHDTMIWNKGNCSSIGSLNRYENVFEYMFVFSKGKPKSANIIKDKPNKRFGEKQSGSIRQANGEVRKTSGYGKRCIAEFGRRHNVWDVVPCKSPAERLHPAPFPEQLAKDHIISWSNEGDTVLDCFMGSGTTGKMAVLNNRKFIGIELDEGYFNIAKKRIEEAVNDLRESENKK